MAVVSLPAKYRATVGSSAEQDLGVVTDAADDYTERTRAMSAVPYYNIDLRLAAMVRADHTELVTFLATNRQSEILVEIDGITYRTRLAGSLKVSWSHGNSMADCSLKLRGVVHE